MPKRGLPETLRMRHDAHYVETLAASAGAPGGPDGADRPDRPQPRPAAPGHGRPGRADRLGHRKGHHRAAGGPPARRRATRSSPASAATTPPRRPACTSCRSSSATSTTREMLELALVENIQRKDLTPFEESEAMQSLAQRCGYTHEDLAKRLGKSRTSITESLSLTGIPPEVRKVCRLAGITNRVAAAANRASGRPAEDAGAGRKDRQPGRRDPRAAPQGRTPRNRRPGRPKAFVFTFRPPSKAFNLRLSFNKRNATKDEVIAALEDILDELKQRRSRDSGLGLSGQESGAVSDRGPCVVS